MSGLSDGCDATVVRGEAGNDEDGFAVFYKKEGRVIAADCVKRPKEFLVSKQLIAAGTVIENSILQDESSDPGSWI